MTDMMLTVVPGNAEDERAGFAQHHPGKRVRQFEPPSASPRTPLTRLDARAAASPATRRPALHRSAIAGIAQSAPEASATCATSLKGRQGPRLTDNLLRRGAESMDSQRFCPVTRLRHHTRSAEQKCAGVHLEPDARLGDHVQRSRSPGALGHGRPHAHLHRNDARADGSTGDWIRVSYGEPERPFRCAQA